MSTVQQISQNQAFGKLSTGTLSTPGSLTTGSITFPTAGGTPTPLADYEEYTDVNFVWNGGSSYTPSTTTTTLSLVRIGNIVMAHLPAVLLTGNGTGGGAIFTSTSSIPARFCPSSTIFVALGEAQNSGGGGGTNLGTVRVRSNGLIDRGLFAIFSPFGFTNLQQYGHPYQMMAVWTV